MFRFFRVVTDLHMAFYCIFLWFANILSGVWHITGLDRAGKPVSTEIKKQLWQLVMDSIRSREIPGKSELDNK